MQGGSRPQIPQIAGVVIGVSGQTLHSQTSPGLYFYLMLCFYYYIMEFVLCLMFSG